VRLLLILGSALSMRPDSRVGYVMFSSIKHPQQFNSIVQIALTEIRPPAKTVPCLPFHPLLTIPDGNAGAVWGVYPIEMNRGLGKIGSALQWLPPLKELICRIFDEFILK
jgi:hypothetical protein